MPPISSYAGPLTPQQAADGIQVALLNARTLLLDARLLLQNERWPRAAALAILAIEEAGKVPIIRATLLVRSESDLRDEWRAYRSHIRKNVMGHFFAYVKEANHLENFRPLFDPASDLGAVAEAFKQLAMYSDCVGDGRWTSPDISVGRDLAEMVVEVAQELIHSDEGAMQSPEELALWVKHLGPVWKTDMTEMLSGLRACYHEAEDTGVLRGSGNANAMFRFLFPKLVFAAAGGSAVESKD